MTYHNKTDVLYSNVYYDRVLGLIRSDVSELPDEDDGNIPEEEQNENNVEDPDDLHEIKVDDDLNEPNPDPEPKPKTTQDPGEPEASES
ncbi:MAG: hypothetical protein ACTHJ8_15655 [Mucilaginibacter sp.]